MAIYMLEVQLRDDSGQWNNIWAPMNMPCYSIAEAMNKAKRDKRLPFRKVRIAKYERTEIYEILTPKETNTKQ